MCVCVCVEKSELCICVHYVDKEPERGGRDYNTIHCTKCCCDTVMTFFVCRSSGSGRRAASPRGESGSAGTFEVAGVELDKEDSRRAKMLYDYEAEDEDGITIAAGEVV